MNGNSNKVKMNENNYDSANKIDNGQRNSVTSKKENLEILEKLAKLKDAGIITTKEFQDKKKKILLNI